jgi:two-component system cell cycle sensor histidine kinase/response regulator CckA
VMKLMKVTLPSTIVIKEEIDESCGRVLIDPVQMHQVLINLCTNASHSMGGGHGDLYVRLAPAKKITDGRAWLELSVEDTGWGIEKDHLERIFDPYFSTKEKTRGTGMGLAMVHGIVTSQGGDIQVESELGKGSIFRIYLPIADATTPVEQVAEIGDIRGGSGRILLVDDEAQVVEVTGEILKSLGYEVIGRTSAAEILELFSREPENYDLLMTDLTMPGLTGLELSERVKEIRADIPIILCTGFSETMSEEKAVSLGIKGFLWKPIVMKDLANKIREVLDKN